MLNLTFAPAETLRVRKLNPDAIVPTRADPGSIGYDLYADHDQEIIPGMHALVKTGIAVAIPDGHYGRVAPRSGLAMKHGIDVFAGVVDPSYRGEIGCVLYNSGLHIVFVKKGDRVAQLILERASILPVEEVADLDETERGIGGYGSSGQ